MTVSKAAMADTDKGRKDAADDGAGEGGSLQLGELSGLLGYSLKRAQLKIFEDFLRCVAPLQLTPAQFSVLLLLEKNPGRNQTEIANTLGILRPNFVAMLDGLESRDLCTRMRSTNDRRSHVLMLTDKGRSVLVLGFSSFRGAAQRRAMMRNCASENPYSRRWLWIPACVLRTHPGVTTESIHQNHPDIVDIRQRRAGSQEIAGRGEERGGVVVVQVYARVEPLRLHFRKCPGIDQRAGRV
jgi:DNA-binding MarR family transcriptional regulator